MRYLLLLTVLLPSCLGHLDLQNSAQYSAEIRPLRVQAVEVAKHIRADRARGKTDDEIAADAGWALLMELQAFLMEPFPTSQPAR